MFDKKGNTLRYLALTALTVAASAIAMVGVGTSATPAPRPVPTAGETPLLEGRYASSAFEPAFAFTVADPNWRVEHDVRHDTFFFYGSPCCLQHADAVTGFLLVLQPTQVYDPTRDVLVAAPADLSTWLRHNRHLKAGPTSPITIDGQTGTQFAASFASPTKNGGGCANFVPNSAGTSFGPFLFCPGDRARLAVLAVDGKQVLIVMQTVPGPALASFLPKARKLLASVQFDPGSARAAKPLTLLLGNADPTYDAEAYFARKVGELSHGTLQVSMQSGLYNDSANNEQLVVRDLQRKKLALAWDPTRVWDTRGVTSYQALQAPFLIDGLPLFKRVLTSPVAQEAASGTRKAGVIGLAVTAVNLRRILGAKRPFRSPADFHGAKINIRSSRLSEQTISALGATPLAVGGALHDDLHNGTLDGAETSIDVVYENGYGDVAKYLTGNLVLFPKPAAIDINAAIYGRLTPTQRSILRKAAHATIARSIELLSAQETQDARAVCKSGIKFANATPADLAALTAAEQPVYDQLAKNPLTAKLIHQIQALKQHAAKTNGLSIPPSCRA